MAVFHLGKEQKKIAMICNFPNDGPCYYRKGNAECGRQPGVECLKPYRDGMIKKSEDYRFLMGTAALFRQSDPNRCAELERIAAKFV